MNAIEATANFFYILCPSSPLNHCADFFGRGEGGQGGGGEKVCLRVQDAFLLNEIITILKPLLIAVEVTSVLCGKK